jgi:hypothetical protein
LVIGKKEEGRRKFGSRRSVRDVMDVTDGWKQQGGRRKKKEIDLSRAKTGTIPTSVVKIPKF